MQSEQPSAGPREERRQRTREAIVAAAWTLSREQGLTGWGLRDLGARVGMRAPSLYVYFASKSELYDEMYAQGYRELQQSLAGLRESALPPEAKVRTGARLFFDFAVADSARLQLLFLRVIPSFTPSPESYALAQRVLDELTQALQEVGVHGESAVDLWTAVLTGLATQQVSNDPGGGRWAALVDDAVDLLLGSHQCTHLGG